MGIGSKVKDLGKTAGKGILKGTQIVIDEAKRRQIENSRKERILNIMFPAVIKKFAHEKGLRPDGYGIQDYKDIIMENVSLDEILLYCKRINLPIPRDLQEEIDRDKIEQDIKNISQKGQNDEKFEIVAKSIEEFKPSQRHPNEFPYQAELFQFLRGRFPNTIIEDPRMSSRPDITVDGIAIEVKGPTNHIDLDTISSKCYRYSKDFPKGLIIVLFNVMVNPYFFKNWKQRIIEAHPNVLIIPK